MPTFQYEARALDGAKVKGKMEAVDENTVRSSLRERSYYPISVRPFSESMNIDLSKYSKIPIKAISIFCRQFAFTVSSGMNILKAMEIVTEQTENQKFRNILRFVKVDVEKGNSLSASLRKHPEIPDMLVNMIEVGEASGNLDDVMIRMADYYDKSYKLQRKIRGSLTYPLMICVVAVIVVNLLLIFVLPTFVGLITSSGGELPWPTRFVMGISEFMQNYGLVMMLLGGILIFVMRLVIKNSPNLLEGWDGFKLRIPIFGKIINKIVTARFARTFGTLTTSGLPILSSINICTRTAGNALVSRVLQGAEEDVRKGHGIGTSLEARGVFPTMLTQMMRIGEETGTLDSIMEKTAEFYDSEVETATQQIASLIEPMIIVVLAVVVGFIVIAMLLPMFDMFDAVGNM
jgi:type IV pilus assembly protein PilC